MWIVRIALTRPYTFIVAALVIVLMTPIVLQRTPTDVFPNIDIPVVSICLELFGLVPATDGRPHRLALRALHDHGGGQHRAHRVADGGGPLHHQGLLSARRGCPCGRHADHGHLPDHDPAVAPRHFPAAHHHLFGVERARPAIGHERARGFPSRSCSISERIWFATSWRPWPGRRFLGLMAGSSARFR